MRVADVSQWGFLLEHEQLPFFVPLGASHFGMKMTSEVQMNDIKVRISTGDYPFYLDKEGVGHIIMKGSEHAKMIMEAMVNYAKANYRRR